MCFGGGGGGGGGGGAATQAAKNEALERKASIDRGMWGIDAAFSGFNDDFFNQTRKAYLDFVTPSFDRQAADARQQLEYGLARSGLGNSSAAARERSNLDLEIGTQRQGLAENAESAVMDQRRNVDTARSTLVAQLQGDADAQGAANRAGAQAAALTAMRPAFSPIGELFKSVGGTLRDATGGEGLAAFAGGSGSSARLFGRKAA